MKDEIIILIPVMLRYSHRVLFPVLSVLVWKAGLLNGRVVLLPFDAPMLLVTDPGKEKETIIRLARVGFDKVKGYLDGGYEAWKNSGEEIDMIIDVEADELMMDIPFDKNLVVVDVRRPTEYADGHLKDAINHSTQ